MRRCVCLLVGVGRAASGNWGEDGIQDWQARTRTRSSSNPHRASWTARGPNSFAGASPPRRRIVGAAATRLPRTIHRCGGGPKPPRNSYCGRGEGIDCNVSRRHRRAGLLDPPRRRSQRRPGLGATPPRLGRDATAPRVRRRRASEETRRRRGRRSRGLTYRTGSSSGPHRSACTAHLGASGGPDSFAALYEPCV